MKLDYALSIFYNATLADGKAMATVVWYRQRLSRLAQFLGDVEIENITIEDLRAFLVHLRTKNQLWADNAFRKTENRTLSVSTIHSYVRAIKRLFNWLEFEGYISTAQNAAIRLKKPRLPKAEPKNISQDDFVKLLHAAHLSKFPERNYAMILFLADTGARVGGLVDLRIQDLDLENNMALVTEKGRKSRYVFFGDETKIALQKWIEKLPNDTHYVFIGQRGRLTISGVNQILRKIKKRAGIVGRVNPHSFRHLFAKRYLQNGGDLATLADLMGHSDVLVTKNSYSIFLTSELKKKHHQHSGLSNLLKQTE